MEVETVTPAGFANNVLKHFAIDRLQLHPNILVDYDEPDNKTTDDRQQLNWKENLIMNVRREREDERLKTFDLRPWPHNWLDKKQLAMTGMYFTGQEDKVKCVFCGVEIGKWEPEDDIIGEHLRFSPHCPLLKRRTTDNVPIDAEALDRILPAVSYDICGTGSFTNVVSEGTIPADRLPSEPTSTLNSCAQTYRHAFPEYALTSSRLSSFDDWPMHMKQKPQQMAEAGFFYTGVGDRVKCFSCGGGLKDWDDNDNPWEQHAIWLTNCNYVKLMKGQTYIDKLNEQRQCGKATTTEQAAQTQIAACSNVRRDTMATPQANDEQAPAVGIPEEKLCKICYAEEYNTAFLPCGHVVACAKCASSVDKCPLCRKPFINVMRVYFS